MTFDSIVLLEHETAIMDKVMRIVTKLSADGLEFAFHVLLVDKDPPNDLELLLYVVGFREKIKLSSCI
ncbi:uncharacterized protein PG998_012273 [Apiospora kogelbergensis]|uniref:uncharacterized protein n=1 Tax=Apiospora kogelbergensis TaxID=1337665 RepID=UPI00312F92B3